jgi:hypothetical protein
MSRDFHNKHKKCLDRKYYVFRWCLVLLDGLYDGRLSKISIWLISILGKVQSLHCEISGFHSHEYEDESFCLLSWWWRQYKPLKYLSPSTRLNSALFHKAVILIFTVFGSCSSCWCGESYVSALQPVTGPLFMWIWNPGGMVLTGKLKKWSKNLSSVTLYATDPTWADTGSNSGLHLQRPMTNYS